MPTFCRACCHHPLTAKYRAEIVLTSHLPVLRLTTRNGCMIMEREVRASAAPRTSKTKRSRCLPPHGAGLYESPTVIRQHPGFHVSFVPPAERGQARRVGGTSRRRQTRGWPSHGLRGWKPPGLGPPSLWKAPGLRDWGHPGLQASGSLDLRV